MDFDKMLDYLKGIDLSKADGENIILTDDAEKVLVSLLEADAFLSDARDLLKERFVEIAKKNPKLRKYEGKDVSVGYRVTRRKKIDGTPDSKFVVVQRKPNTKAITEYQKAVGKLPTGIGEKVFEYVTFKRN